ncbi:cysteine peptidase family C39 domain-containing protein [Escherichia albertii]
MLVEIIEDKYIIHDPDIGAIEKSLEHFLDIFSGFAIIIG